MPSITNRWKVMPHRGTLWTETALPQIEEYPGELKIKKEMKIINPGLDIFVNTILNARWNLRKYLKSYYFSHYRIKWIKERRKTTFFFSRQLIKYQNRSIRCSKLPAPGRVSPKLKVDVKKPKGNAPIPKDMWKPPSPNPNPENPAFASGSDRCPAGRGGTLFL